VPGDVVFQTKPQIALDQLPAALSAGGFCRTYDEFATFFIPAPDRQVSADYGRLHFLRRTATVLSVLEEA
jgi:hypothetical protein